MKVTKSQGQPAFQPIELKITIESAEEHAVLYRVLSHEITVPKLLCEGDVITEEQRILLRKIMAEIFHHLTT